VLDIVGAMRILGSINDSIAAFFIAAAVVAWRQAKTTYKIFFGTADGERRALQSEDGEYVFRVADSGKVPS
jgi:hypothetical protein